MSHQDLIHRLKRKQEVFSKLGGLVSTLQRQENVGQWKSKLEELEEIRAERDQLRLEAEEKDAMVSELTKTNDELNGAVGTLHDDLKRLNDRFMQEKEVAQQLNDHISRMQADLQSGSESKVQAAVWEQKYLDCRAELEGSKATVYERENTVSRLRADLRSMESTNEVESKQMAATMHELKEQLWQSIEENKMRELQQQRDSFFTGAGGGAGGGGKGVDLGMGGMAGSMQGQYTQGYSNAGPDSWQHKQEHSGLGGGSGGKGTGKAKNRGANGSPLRGGKGPSASSPSAASLIDGDI